MTQAADLRPSLQPADGQATRTDRVPLIAYARDKETLGILADVLGPELGPRAEFRLGGIPDARIGLRSLTAPISALLVDVSGESDRLAALEELSLYVEPGVRVFVIGDAYDMAFYRQVVRGLGVIEYLSKPLSRDVTARLLLPMLTGTHAIAARGGQVVTVTGVRGGVGTTTVAVNLAVQLAERSRHYIALLDADLNAGSAAMLLSAEPAGGLRGALENPERVDSLFIDRAAAAINDRLHILAAEEPLDALIAPAQGAAANLVSVLSGRYNFVIIDLPGTVTPLYQQLRGLAHVRVLVMDATLPSIRDALRHLALPRSPRQASRPIIVLNRLGAPGALTRKQVTEGLGTDVDVVVPWLPKQMQAATNTGRAAAGKRGSLAGAMTELATQILPKRPETKRTWTDFLRKSRS